MRDADRFSFAERDAPALVDDGQLVLAPAAFIEDLVIFERREVIAIDNRFDLVADTKKSREECSRFSDGRDAQAVAADRRDGHARRAAGDSRPGKIEIKRLARRIHIFQWSAAALGGD